MTTFFGIIHDAQLEYRKRLLHDKEITPDTLARQIARRFVPLRSEELLALASQNLHLALKTPRNGPAFSKRPTPVNLIAANLYEAICASLKSDPSEGDRETPAFHTKKLCQ